MQTTTFENGDVYIGDTKFNSIRGEGTLTKTDGTKIQGTFEYYWFKTNVITTSSSGEQLEGEHVISYHGGYRSECPFVYEGQY